MKTPISYVKKITVGILLSNFMFAFAGRYKIYQTENFHNSLRLDTRTGEVVQIQDDGGSWICCYPITPESDKWDERYTLHPTENMWNYLELDRLTGKVMQVQFGIKNESQGVWIINPEDLRLDSSSTYRFSLKPTQNIWQFHVLDEYSGRLWLIQFSVKSDPPNSEKSYRWIKSLF